MIWIMNFMNVLSFDICGLVLLIILIFSTVSRKMTSGTQGRVFILTTWTTLLALVFDMWSLVCDSLALAGNNVASVPRYIAHSGYLFFHNLTSLFFLVYLVSVADTWHKKLSNILLKILSTAPYIAIAFLLAINPFTGMMFYFNDNSEYTRGPYFFILYLIAFIFMSSGMIYTIAHKNLFTKGKFIALLSIVPLQLTAVLIQMINKDMIIEMFFNAICILLMNITVQKPEEIVDSFTGLRKYSAYTTDIKRNFYNDKHVSVIMINLSNYSTLFGLIGYDASNDILQKIAGDLISINKELKTHADIYYLDRGRFRFVVNEKNRPKIGKAAEMINSMLRKSVIINNLELNLIAHVCISRCPEDISDFKTLMSFGNDFHITMPYTGRVMFASKIAEKNRFQLSSELDSIIDAAIANRKFQVYYQPIFSVEKKKFASAEALLRLNDEKYGFIPPDIFIAAAEKSGAIHRIGDYVLEEVCRFISRKEFEELGLDYIEINLSVSQCMQADLADKVINIIKRFNVSPDKINLEITETAANYAQNIMTANIDKLINAGISFSLDDYGTGYSNMKSVASLPLKIVKLDKSLVDSEDNPRMWIVLQNTIKMLKDMEMHIVVEGVETEHLVKKFSDLNCEYIQGYYFSKPIPEEEFIQFMRNSVKAAKKS